MTDDRRLRLVAAGMMALVWGGAVGASNTMRSSPEVTTLSPFGLSLSKPCPSFCGRKEQPFDKLRANGGGESLSSVLKANLAAERARPVPAQISRDAFLVEPAISAAAIAPDGRHVAWLRKIGEETSLWLKPAGGAARKLLRRADADDIFWSHDGRWLFLVSDRTIRMIAVSGNLGSGLVAQLGGSTGLSFAGIDPWRPAAAILKEERRIDGQRDPIGYRLWRVERGGKRRLIAYGRRDPVDFAISPDGHIAFAKIVEGDHHVILARRSDGRYRVLARCVRLERCDLAGTTTDGRGLYLASDLGGDLRAVMRIDADGRRTLLHRDPSGERDLDSLAIDPLSGAPIIAGYRGGTPASYGLTDDARHAMALLAKRLPGDITISPTSGQWLVRERGSRLQGLRWFLFDPRAGRLDLILDDSDKRPRVPEAALAATFPVSFPASDGMLIHGLLTVPAGRNLAHVPLIAAVHGGPWSNDELDYSTTTQLLANRGYAVFRPQFRGSTGYGRAYMLSPRGDFGDGRVQRDIEEGVRWLLARGIGDPRRVGIAGASFGGYSTLQALSNGSGLFRVGVAIVPPADFGWVSRQAVGRGNIGSSGGIAFATTLRLLGLDARDPAIARRLTAQSPFARVAAMRTPLLIIAAGRDERVPIRSVIDYAARLRQLGRDADVIVARKQPHAPDDPMARRAYLYFMEAMLARHLGGPVAAPPAEDLRQWIATSLDEHTAPEPRHPSVG
jgi:dipeptidyl aminopeptidase/acylaminoacyl peptidase